MLQGKGMYVWQIKQCEGGDIAKAAQVAKDAGIQHVLIKILDGVYSYNLRPYYVGNSVRYADDILKPAVQTFQAAGIEVWGWQYVYLADAVREGQRAVERAHEMGVTGFICDVEGECKNKPTQTRQYLNEIKNIGIPVALSSYRWPTLHMEIDWRAWMTAIPIQMPQVYWMMATNAGYQLRRSYQEFDALRVKYGLTNYTYMATGAAFSEGGWHVEPSQIIEFLTVAKELHLPAVNFWEWNYPRRWAGWWDAIANFAYAEPPQPPETVSVDRFVIEQLYPLMVQNWKYNGPAPA